MSFGYIGDISTKIKQQVKNTGILSISEAFDLERQGFLGGSIELIQSQTVSGVASVQFTSIKGSEYDNHLMECVNLSLDSDNSNIRFDVRFSSDGGSSFPNSSYHYGFHYFESDGTTFGELRSANATEINNVLFSSDTSSTCNGRLLFYNLNDSTSYSYMTSHTTSYFASTEHTLIFGGGGRQITESVDGIIIFTHNSANFSGTVNLYGIKE